jgi:hypothetical protein
VVTARQNTAGSFSSGIDRALVATIAVILTPWVLLLMRSSRKHYLSYHLTDSPTGQSFQAQT